MGRRPGRAQSRRWRPLVERQAPGRLPAAHGRGRVAGRRARDPRRRDPSGRARPARGAHPRGAAHLRARRRRTPGRRWPHRRRLGRGASGPAGSRRAHARGAAHGRRRRAASAARLSVPIVPIVLIAAAPRGGDQEARARNAGGAAPGGVAPRVVPVRAGRPST
ncbi:hypothetical protein FRIGORI9N_30031 [Frigoribacterium sp. 9N]|nr:hypothetical protein FRIGORI9N_30031 [Frigoribacterium sp. 9N]